MLVVVGLDVLGVEGLLCMFCGIAPYGRSDELSLWIRASLLLNRYFLNELGLAVKEVVFFNLFLGKRDGLLWARKNIIGKSDFLRKMIFGSFIFLVLNIPKVG